MTENAADLIEPYYSDDLVTLYHGDCRELLPELGLQADLIVTDPPYGETSLDWDRWPDGWPTLAARHARSMWCFGSMRMFLDRRAMRLRKSVMFHRNLQGMNPINPTQKPTLILEPLITYGCPEGGLVVDLFAGSASTLVAARDTGRRAIGFEGREEQCESAAKRLAQDTLFGGVA